MFDRVTFDSSIMGGRACIRGMRIPVSVIVGQIAYGAERACRLWLRRAFDRASAWRVPQHGAATNKMSASPFSPAVTNKCPRPLFSSTSGTIAVTSRGLSIRGCKANYCGEWPRSVRRYE